MEQTLFLNRSRSPSPTRGNDEKSLARINNEKRTLVDEFFKKVISNKKQNSSFEKIALIVINHIVPTLPPFLNALATMDVNVRVAVVIPKGSYHNSGIFNEIKKKYEIANEVTRDYLAEEDNACEFVKKYIKADEKFLIIDIGGYFAAPLARLCKAFEEKFVGIVEDTENGHQKYIASLLKSKKENYPICPIVSVARCELKETEDYNVGKSIVEGAGIILRTNAHTMLERMKTIGVIGFGKIGRSIAEHLRQKNVREILVYDKDVIRQMKASSIGFKVVNKDEIFLSADMIFGATGNQSLEGFEFFNLKDNVFIASCTSHDDEFDLTILQSFSGESSSISSTEHSSKNLIDKYYLSSKRINLLYKGDAVNFVHGAVNGPYIYSVQAGLIVGAIDLITKNFKTEDIKFEGDTIRIPEIKRSDMEDIARIWLENFEDFKHISKSHLNNETLFSYLSTNKDNSFRAMVYLRFAVHLYNGCINESDREKVRPLVEFLYQEAIRLMQGLAEANSKELQNLKNKLDKFIVGSEVSSVKSLEAAAQEFINAGYGKIALYLCENDSLKESSKNDKLILIKIKAYSQLNDRIKCLELYNELNDNGNKQEAKNIVLNCFPELSSIFNEPPSLKPPT